MGIVCGFCSLIICILCLIIEKKNFSLAVLFTAYWGIIMILSGFRLWGLYAVNDVIYQYILLGEVLFVLGYFLSNRVCLKNFKYKEYKYSLNNTLFKLFFWILLVTYLIIDRTILKLLLSGVKFATIRYQYMDVVLNTYFLSVIFKFILTPLTWAYVIACFVEINVRKKIRRDILFCAFILSLFDFLTISDRSILMLWLSGALMTWLLFHNDISLGLRRKIYRIILCAVGLIMIVVVMRGGNVLESMYFYLVGCLNFFSYRIPQLMERTYGVSSLQGFFRPIMGIFEKTGYKWELFELADKFLLENQYTVISLNSDNQNFNYFISAFGYFYNDGGIIGVMIMSFIWGMLSGQIWKKIRKNKENYVVLSLLMMMIFGILMSVMQFCGANNSFVYGSIAYIFLFIKRKKLNKKQEI